MAGWMKMPLGKEVGLGQSNIVLHGDQAPSQKKAAQSPILATVCCGQMAGWIKIPLGTEVGLSPGHNSVIWETSPRHRKGHSSPHFWPMYIVVKRSPIFATAELLLTY